MLGDSPDREVAVEAAAVPARGRRVRDDVVFLLDPPCGADQASWVEVLWPVAAVGEAEAEGLVAVRDDPEGAVVQGAMVRTAEQDEVGQVRGSAVYPVPDVVRVQVPAAAATGCGAAAVAQHQCPELLRGDEPAAATQVEHLGPVPDCCTNAPGAKHSAYHGVGKTGSVIDASDRAPGAFS